MWVVLHRPFNFCSGTPVLAFKETPFPTAITLILPSTVIVTSSSSEWANAEPSICKLNQRITNVSRQRKSKRLLS